MSRSAQDLAAQAVIGDKGIGKEPEMAVIADMLADGERFFGAVPGIYGSGNGILAATDRRLIFAYKGLVGGTTVEEFPYVRIDAIKHKTGLLMGEISVGKTKIDHVDKRLIPSFVRGVQAAMGGAEPTPDIQEPTPDIQEAPPEAAAAEHKRPKAQAANGTKRRWPKIAMLVGAALVGLYMLGSGQQPASVPTSAPESVAAATPRGLGVSRATIVALLGPSGAGYPIASAGQIGGQDRWMGQAGTGIAEVIGPADNVTKVSVIGGMANDDMNNNAKHLIDMAHTMETVLPRWPEGKKWIIDSLPKAIEGQAQSITRDGIRVAMKYIDGIGMLALSFEAE